MSKRTNESIFDQSTDTVSTERRTTNEARQSWLAALWAKLFGVFHPS
ncbi:hypothetical protein EVB87_044 [Rhizobium phage RHph_N28_1]|nr:hypothetical protein EVB87_044 [Rhizobium phage RHph_N28_1]QIG74072.1 hypothetical protein EVC07_044 [Rhizobium phage RHph_N42]